MSDFIKRRGLLMAMLTSPLLTACIWPRFFEFNWDEEVQLHDGRQIVVRMKYMYERVGSGLTFDQYDSAMLRETTITFDSGPPNGMVTQLFVHQRPMLLDTENGEWFVVLQGRAGSDVQNWGSAQNGNGQRTVQLVGGSFNPVPINKLPEWMTTANILMDYAPERELAAFNETRLTLAQKTIYLQKYPLDPIDRRIERPRKAYTN